MLTTQVMPLRGESSFVNRERDKQDVRERRDPKAEGQGSQFRKPRTSDLEPSRFLSASNSELRTQNFFAHLARPAFLARLKRITRDSLSKAFATERHEQ